MLRQTMRNRKWHSQEYNESDTCGEGETINTCYSAAIAAAGALMLAISSLYPSLRCEVLGVTISEVVPPLVR